MKRPLSVFIALFTTVVIFYSCKKSDDDRVETCFYVEETAPLVMTAPDSVHTDSTISISVFFKNQKFCQRFSSFSSETIDSTTTIAILTKIDTCNCNDQMNFQTQYFRYQAPSNPMQSIIRIHVSDSTYFQDTIVVY